MSKRLFVGFPVTPPDSLVEAVRRLRIGADKREMEFDWSPAANYHVTLNFLGQTEKLSEIAHTVSKIALGAAPFETSLKGFGGFPDEHHMRVLWCGVRLSRELAQLQSDLTEALSSLGFAPEERDYVPHLTIARTRKNRSGKDLISPFVRHSFGDLVVPSIALYESVMHGARPHYEMIESFALDGVTA